MFLSLGINIGFGLNTTSLAAISGGGSTNYLKDNDGNNVLDNSGNPIPLN